MNMKQNQKYDAPTLREILVRYYTIWDGYDADFAAANRALGELKRKYPHIRYFEVLAYLPKSQPEHETLLPEGIETVPPRFAISRNIFSASSA